MRKSQIQRTCKVTEEESFCSTVCVKSKSQTSEVTDRLTGSHLTFNFLCFSTLPISFHLSDFEVVCLFPPPLLSLSPIILSFLCPRLLLASAHCPLYRFTLDFWSSFFLSVFKSGFFPQQLFFFISSHIRSILMPLSLRVAVHFIVLKVQRGSIIALAQNTMIRLFHLCMTDPPW